MNKDFLIDADVLAGCRVDASNLAPTKYCIGGRTFTIEQLLLLDGLVEALKPFCQEASEWGDLVPDQHVPVSVRPARVGARYICAESKFTVGDLRRARDIILKFKGAS